jgi:hypothetical protein
MTPRNDHRLRRAFRLAILLMRPLHRSDRDVGLELVVSLGHNSRMQRPPTRFAWNGDVSLAYQVCGEGPTDLVYLQGYCSNVDANWDGPHLARFPRGLAAIAVTCDQ